MHEDSCIGINHAHMFSKCFRSLHTLLGFALYFVSSIQLLSLYPFIQFLTCTRIPCRDSHCETGLLRCCLYNWICNKRRWQVSSRGTSARDGTVPKQMPAACVESKKIQAPRKESASKIFESSAVLMEWSLASACARCASVVTTGPNMTYTGWLASPGPLKFRSHFFPAFQGSRYHFPFKLSYKMVGRERGLESMVKNNKFRDPF